MDLRLDIVKFYLWRSFLRRKKHKKGLSETSVEDKNASFERHLHEEATNGRDIRVN